MINGASGQRHRDAARGQGTDASLAHKSAQSIYCILAHLIAKAFSTAGYEWRMPGAWLV